MNLYIETENEQIKNHPAFEENLLQAFGDIPENWKPFKRVERPDIGVYEVLDPEYSEYQLVDGVYIDVWTTRNMTVEEKISKQNETISTWRTKWGDSHLSWVFNKDICAFEPPIVKPQDGKIYRWDESTINWVEVINEQIT